MEWNHNLHHHPLILAAAAGATTALDVGCGEGALTRELRLIVPHVTGIDRDQPMIELARARVGSQPVEYVIGDIRNAPFAPESFDLVCSVATLHHLPAREGLEAMRSLLRPGGTLALVGIARSRFPRDILWELAGALAHRRYRWTRGYCEHPAPMVWPPPETYAGIRRIAVEVLPGVRYRRHVLWRYSLLWTRPAPTP